MNQKILAIIGIVIIVVLSSWLLITWQRSKMSSTETVVDNYKLYSEKDAGANESGIKPGSIIIIQLPMILYGEPISVTDSENKQVTLKKEEYEGSTIVSFPQPRSRVTVRAKSLVASTTDFSLILESQ